MASTHAPEAEIETSEGSVMLAAGMALLVAVLGFGSGAIGGHGHAATHADAAPSAVGAKAAVATASPEASQVALEVMRRGGNAFDALIAASFAVSVTRPQSTGIGGGGFVVWHRNGGSQGTYDGREAAPRSASRDMYLDREGNPTRDSLDGPRAGGVPGLVRMLHRLYEEQSSGRLGWAALVAPAVKLAQDGFVVTDQLAHAIKVRHKVLERYPQSASIFLPGGQVPPVGSKLIQLDLAKTLSAIARDPESFYTGPLADRIVRGVPAFSPVDLSSYKVRTPAPIMGEYRGNTVISMPPPSSGGVHLVQMLNILSQHPLPLGQLQWQGPDHLHLLTEAMRRAYADRSTLGDAYPDVGTPDQPIRGLTSQAYAEELYAGIDMQHATPSQDVQPGGAERHEGDHTTHISIVDPDGNAASSTQTINTFFGSCYVIPNTGILLNNEMDDFAAKPGTANHFGLTQGENNSIAPGRHPLSSMTPTIVLGPDGYVRLVVGSPGGSKIITATLQVLLNVVDFGMPVAEAVASPRIHHQWLYKGRDELFADEGVDEHTLAELARRGHVLHVGGMSLGNVQAVEVQREADGSRRCVAASDPRGTGRPAAY